MSLGLYLSPPKCESCGHEPEGISFNITYNLSKMWYELYPNDTCMLPIEDMKSSESLMIICKAINDFVRHKEKLLPLNPLNGWGSYDHFLKILRAMRNTCEEHHDWIWSAFR